MTGNCPGELVDLDGDRRVELQTCDDSFVDEFCSFAFTPLPPVVFAYDSTERRFILATRRYARRLPPPSAADVKSMFDAAGNDPELQRCAALGPALHAIYTGRVADGQRRFRQQYRGSDAATVETRMMELVRASRFWAPE